MGSQSTGTPQETGTTAQIVREKGTGWGTALRGLQIVASFRMSTMPTAELKRGFK